MDSSVPPRFRKSQIFLTTLGVIAAVSFLAHVSSVTGMLMLLGSFGASALLVFALPEAPLSHPRCVIVGHLSACVIALGCLAAFGAQPWAIGIATGLAVAFMMATRTVHPPAGANAIIVFLAKPAAASLLVSTVAGAVFLVLSAHVYHRATRRHSYPLTWRTRREVTAQT